MIRYTFLIVFMCIAINLLSQDANKQEKEIETKIEAFTSKTGQIIKIVDYNLASLKLLVGGFAETRIRSLSSGGETQYFYQIEKDGQYGSKTASIEYSDLLEIIKALVTLKTEVPNDIASNPNYLENKFITSDGFQVGYYVSQGKSKWYLRLEKYGSDNTVFINDVEFLANAFQSAKSKIEELKGKK